MDHVAVATTMGYYRISLKRKQQAIRSVGSLATDANGNPAPFTSPTAYQRASVSVPFGNCTEPSNVTAGGGACPIRFQCAGCGFYRPDPSYLPALQEHIASLRADLETARAIGAADYVTANLAAQIDAFTTVCRHHAPPAVRTRIRRTRRGRTGQPPAAPGPRRPAAPTDREPRTNHPDRMTTMTDRTAALKAARAKDSNDKRRRVLQTMNDHGDRRTTHHRRRGRRRRGRVHLARLRRRHPRTPRRRPNPTAPSQSTAPHPPRPAPAPATSRSQPPACAPTSPSLDTRSTGYEQISTNSGADCGCNSEPRSNNPTGPNSSHGSPRWKPRTANSSPNATPAPPRPTPPNAASNNSKTTSPPPEKASDE